MEKFMILTTQGTTQITGDKLTIDQLCVSIYRGDHRVFVAPIATVVWAAEATAMDAELSRFKPYIA